MFRRRTKSKPSFLLHTTNRGSDITKPDNTSLIVNQSKKSESRTEELPKALCLSSEDEDDSLDPDSRPTESVMRSMTQKQQSTPVKTPIFTQRQQVTPTKSPIFTQKQQATPTRSPLFTQTRQGSPMSPIFTQKQKTPAKTPILSQKHNNRGRNENSSILSASKGQAKRSLQKENVLVGSPSKKTYYEEVVQFCGAVQLPGVRSYLLSEDQAVFTININKKIKADNTEDKFLKSLEEHISNLDNLKKMLAHTQTSDDCEIARGPVQEPIMRLLLQADCIQIQLCELVLSKIADFIIEADDPDNADFSLVSSLLRQFRFLNRVKESKIAGKLFEIIDVAPVNIQREIIFMLPEILTEDEIEAEKVDSKLVDLLKFNSLLTHVIIDALTNLPLKEELRSQVREKIITRLERCPAEFLPLLVQFVITRCDQFDLPEVVNALRHNLPFTLQHHEIRLADNVDKNGKKNEKKIIDENSYFKLAFENLKFSVMSSKQMTDAWIKIITNVKTTNELRCVDFIMLIIIYSNVCGRKTQMATLMRNKIKAGILDENHVQQFFKILLVVAVEHSSAILELASMFLKSYEPVIADFGVVLYEEAFTNYSFYLRQNVISEVLLHIGSGTCSNINMALTILTHLKEKSLETLSEHTVSIMGLLMKLPDLEAMQVRTLVDVIASLIFSNFTDDALGSQDELQMFIQKQISAFNVELHRKGVVAAIMFAKHAVANLDEQNCEGKLTDVNSLLELAMGTRSSYEAKRAFFYDELATMIREEDEPNASFTQAWRDHAYKQAMESMFARNIDLECDYFPMSLQYALETPDEKKLVFPILDFIIKLNTNKNLDVPVSVMPSILRLLWCSEKEFARIEPLMSAAVILPAPAVFEKFGTFDTTEQKMIIDCLYLCANFFLESINAFCTQKSTEKVIIRIKQLIEVRKLIVRHQHLVPDYIPPLCQFYAPIQKPAVKKRPEPKKPKKGRKRKSDGTAAEPGPSSQAPSQGPSQAPMDMSELPGTSANISSVEIIGHAAISHEESDLQAYRGYFRELHCHTLKMLRVDMTLNPSVVFKKTKLSDILVDEISWTYRPTEKPELGPSDLLFLIEDFIYKADHVFKEKRCGFNMKSKPIFSTIEHITSDIFIAGSIKILPKLCQKLDLLSSYCKDLIESNDGVYDAMGMYPKDAADIKLAFAAGLRAVAAILSWRGFQNPNNRPLAKDALRILSSCTTSQSIATVTNLAIQAADYLSNFIPNVLLLPGAISIVKSIEICFQFGNHRNNVLYALCYDLLCRPWFTVNGSPERGAAFNQNVDILLKTYFSNVDDKLEVVKKLSQTAVDEVEQLSRKDSAMDTLKTINKSNFPLLYRALCEALVTGASAELSKVHEDHELCLKTWGKIVNTCLVLVEIVKIQSSRINLAALLKRSQSIIQLFLSKGMPVMETALRVKSNEVLKLLKSLQVMTRYLHAICCHSKITSDSVVAAHVPAIRSLCEKITLEVKGMLILNKIPLDCMTIAILKNRDLQGNDILSQTTNNDSDDESELPPEEIISDAVESEQDNDEDSRDSRDSRNSNSEFF